MIEISRHLICSPIPEKAQKLIVPVQPVAAPRMTQRDKWARRPCVEKYFRFREALQLQANLSNFELGNEIFMLFVFEMPASYSKKKKESLLYQPMQNKPDIDNVAKSCVDALKNEDKQVWNITAKKIWGVKPMVIIINV